MKSIYLLISFLLIFSLIGCPSTHQARKVEDSGFLKDYSRLKKGEGDEALQEYINPAADFSAYDKVLIDHITLWRPAKSDLAELDEVDVQNLGNYLHKAIKTQLEKDYKIVTTPGPGVMRIRVAITEASDSSAPMNMITTIVPVGIVISAGKRLITGTAAFVGAAGIEGEITDSASGKVLAEIVDRRVGTKRIAGSWSSWDGVDEAYNYWAEKLRRRLAEKRSH